MKEKDEFLIELFYNKIRQDDFTTMNDEILNREERLKENFNFLSKEYELIEIFLAEDAKEAYNFIFFFEEWFGLLSESKFHKNPLMEESFLNFKEINKIVTDKINQKMAKDDKDDSGNKGNIFFKKFLTSIIKSVTLVRIKAIETSYKAAVSEKDEYWRNGKTENFSYTKNFLVNLAYSNIQSWVLIASHALGLTINIDGIYECVSHFLLHLEFRKYFKISEEIAFGKDKRIRLLSHEIRNTALESRLFENSCFEYPYFDFNVCKFIPILMVNKYTISKDYKLKAAVQVQDFLFKNHPLVQEKNKYGYQTTQYSFNEEKRSYELKKKRKRTVIDFEKNKRLRVVLKRENERSCFMEWENCKNYVLDFYNKNLSFTGLWDKENGTKSLDYKKYLETLKTFRSLTDPKSKKVFTDLFLFLHLLKLLEMQDYEKIYFPEKKDNRGREYYLSIVSPTSLLASRFFMHLGYYSKKEFIHVVNESLKSKSLYVLDESIGDDLLPKNICHRSYFENDDAFLNDGNLLVYKKNILKNLFFSIGAVSKSTVLKNKDLCPNGYMINLEAFFRYGVMFYQNVLLDQSVLNNITDLETKKKIEFYFYSIKNGVDFFKKSMIGLDFSCSGHQLRYLYNGLRDEQNYKLLNVDGKNWFTDLYTLIIKLFKEYEKQKRKDDCEKAYKLMDKYFERKYLKRSLMTGEYNATVGKFTDYFFESIKENPQNEEIFNELLGDKTLNSLLKSMCEFNKNLSTLTEEFACLETQESGIRGIGWDFLSKNGFKIKYGDGWETSYAIFKKNLESKRIYYTVKNKNTNVRKTHCVESFTDEVDYKKLKTAFVPNFIHGCDAFLVRGHCYYNKFTQPITVHDEYWIPFQESFLFRDLINKVIKLCIFSELSEDMNIEDHKLIRECLREMFSFLVIL